MFKQKLSLVIAISLSLLLSVTTLHAADKSSDPDFLGLISHMWKQKCPELVRNLVTRKDVEGALQSRPIDVEQVCSCSNIGLLADDKLRAQFVGEPQAIQARMQDSTLKAYFTLRMIQSAFVCLGDDIERSLDAVSFAQ